MATMKGPTAAVEQLERFIDGLGYPGRYQVLVYVLLTFNFILLSFCDLSDVFFNQVPQHRCKLAPRHQSLAKYDESYPVEMRDSAKVFSSCVMWADPVNRSSGLKKCFYGWEYKVTGNEWTVASEWNLVCDRKYLLKLIPSIQGALSILGAILFGSLADKFGRRPVLLFTLFLLSIAAGSIYFLYNFTAYMVIKGLQGFFGAGLFIASYVMCIEVVPAAYRGHSVLGVQVIACCSAVCLVVTNYFITHWRYVQLSITVPFTVTIMYIWLIPESIRWLITESKVEESKCSAQRTLRYNKLPVQENLMNELRRIIKLRKDLNATSNSDAGVDGNLVNSHAFWDLFATHETRKRILILFANWFTSALAYSFMAMTVAPLTHNHHADIVVAALVEAGSAIVILILVIKFGCRVPLCCCFAVVGLIGILSAVLPRVIDDRLLITQILAFLSLLGKTISFATLALSQMYCTELMPTTLRATGFGLCLMWAKVGHLLGPQLYKLRTLTIPAVPFVSVGALDLVCCVLTAFLPPTHRSPLPGIVDDIDEPRQKTPRRRQFSGIYTIDGSYSSRAQDVIRKEAVIKTVSSSNSSNLSTAQHINTVRFTNDVIDVGSSASSSSNRVKNDVEESDSDDGGFTTFGKSGGKRQRVNSVDLTSERSSLATFVKTNPLLISDPDSEDDNTIMGISNGLHSSHDDSYSPQFFLRSRNFVDLDTAVL